VRDGEAEPQHSPASDPPRLIKNTHPIDFLSGPDQFRDIANLAQSQGAFSPAVLDQLDAKYHQHVLDAKGADPSASNRYRLATFPETLEVEFHRKLRRPKPFVNIDRYMSGIVHKAAFPAPIGGHPKAMKQE